MHAAANGHHEVVQLLLAAGAIAGTRDRDGQSSLVYAANTGSTKVRIRSPSDSFGALRIPSVPFGTLLIPYEPVCALLQRVPSDCF